MRTKKELLEIVLVFVLGVIFLILLAINVNQYDRNNLTHINQAESL